MRILLVHPGASWSIADVESGLRHGLEAHGATVLRYRLDMRIDHAQRFLASAWRRSRRTGADVQKPTTADCIYLASVGVLEMALRHQVDAVLVVSGVVLHPDAVILMKRAGLVVSVLFTESPYDEAKELRIARLVDVCWTNERTSLELFRQACARAGYLPCAYHPEVHRPDRPVDESVSAHDVVFVGSGWRSRVKFFAAIDWTGIDLGLYGTWRKLGLPKALERIARPNVPNALAAQLYRRAKIGLNLYRTEVGWSKDGPMIPRPAESLSPRAYELAAVGAFHVSEWRPEVVERFGDLVPTFRTPDEASMVIRQWLADEDGRARVAAQLPATVAGHSWVDRAGVVLADLASVTAARAAERG